MFTFGIVRKIRDSWGGGRGLGWVTWAKQSTQDYGTSSLFLNSIQVDPKRMSVSVFELKLILDV